MVLQELSRCTQSVRRKVCKKCNTSQYSCCCCRVCTLALATECFLALEIRAKSSRATVSCTAAASKQHSCLVMATAAARSPRNALVMRSSQCNAFCASALHCQCCCFLCSRAFLQQQTGGAPTNFLLFFPPGGVEQLPLGRDKCRPTVSRWIVTTLSLRFHSSL